MTPVGEQGLPEGNIMVVDDNPTNLRLLEDILREDRYEVRSFPLGRLALAAADREPPDLILLDINMPEMNGYEVCERLKSSARLSAIPVIFLSALNAVEDKVKGFQSGGVDYITKPFQFEEVQARVETHLKLHRLQQALKLQNERLEETVAARTLELAEANQRLTILDCSKSEFLNLISHELRTPLNGLLGVGEIILDDMSSTEENAELHRMFDESRRRICSILDDALLLTQINVDGKRFRSVPVALYSALSRAIDATAEFAGFRDVALTRPSISLDLVLAEENLLERALRALFETAVRFSQPGQTVLLSHEVLPDSIMIMIETSSGTIPDAAVPRFFDVFSIGEASTPYGDLGLGSAVAHRILSLFGASLTVANRDTGGIGLTVSLKRAPRTVVLSPPSEVFEPQFAR